MAAVCEHCVTGHIHAGTPKGTVQTIADLPTYVALPPSNKSAKATILVITDIFGYEVPNARLVADEYAEQGYKVYVPDFFEGDPLPIWMLVALAPWPEQEEQRGKLEKGIDSAAAMAKFGVWSVKHRDAVVRPLINKFLAHLKASPELTTPNGKIGSIGFCWGGRQVVLLADGSAEQSVDASAAFHPAGISVPSELDPVTKPTAILVGEKDTMFDADAGQKAKEIFAKKPDVPTLVQIFPGMVHGFGSRGDLSNDKEREGKEAAHKVAFEWFDKYLA